MSELSKIGIVLTFLFSFFSLALFAEILYLILSRRPSATDRPAGKSTAFIPRFLYRKRQHSGRVEPSGALPMASLAAAEPPEATTELEVAELLKLQHSRLLFTIKEEEREGADWSSERSGSLGDNRRKRLTAGDSPGKCTEVGQESVCSDHSSPFATPCSSPTYYTPSPSPEKETNGSGGGKRWSPEVI